MGSRSFNRKLADLINAQGQVKSSKVDSFDSSEVETIITSNVSGSVVYLNSLDSLPTTGLSDGQKALVKISDSIGRLYISDGSGWYNADTNVNTSSPVWVTEPDASYDIADSATPLIVTALASDPDSDILTNQSFVSDSAQYLVSISNDSSVWTFTPKTADQIGTEVAAGNLEDSSGNFIYTFRWNDGINVLSKAVTISYSTTPSAGIAWGGTRSLTAIGYTKSDYNGNGSNYNDEVNDIVYNDITTPGNAQDFGDLTRPKSHITTFSNGTRAIFWGGDLSSAYSNKYGDDRIEMITPATISNATTFGEVYYENILTSPTRYYRKIAAAGSSDGIYGLQFGGYSGSQGNQTSIEYITIDTQSDASVFGYYATKTSSNSAWNDATRSVMYHGSDAVYYSVFIKYLTTQTIGNATAISNTHPQGKNHASCSDATRGVTFGGDGSGATQLITYNTTQSLSDANTFGNLLAANGSMGAASDGTYGVMFGGGNDTDIEYVTIQTTGNSTDFGDLPYKSTKTSSTSGNAA